MKGIVTPASRALAATSTHASSVMGLRRALSEAFWMTGPSASGSEYGTPSSIMSAPAFSSSTTISTVVRRSGSPVVMNGMSAVRCSALSLSKTRSIGFMLQPSEISHNRFHVLVSAPRKMTAIVWPAGRDGASFITWATAWADSKAGMMPSVRDSSWRASSASASVTGKYSARPMSLRYACSGPIPG